MNEPSKDPSPPVYGKSAKQSNNRTVLTNQINVTNGGATNANPGHAVNGSPVLVCMADVKPESVNWLWPGRISLGNLTLIAGDPGLGKSFLTLDIAARVSTGIGWPEQIEEKFEPGGVVLLNAEDGIANTVRPRLDAAGADVTKIFELHAISKFDKQGRFSNVVFDLTNDLPGLEHAIQTVENCRLVVIDPVTAYLGGTDSHNNADVRRVLAPLAALAAKYQVAVVAVTHLNKSGVGPAIYRAMGSLAFTAAARAAWGVVKDKADNERRLFLPIKNNLASDTGGLAYRIESNDIDSMPVVRWESNPVMQSADEAMSSDHEVGGRTERADAADWLQQYFKSGPRSSVDVLRDSGAAGHSVSTLQRAKKTLGVKSTKTAFDGTWEWSLPVKEDEPPKMLNEDAAPTSSEHLGTNPDENADFHSKVLTSDGVSTLDECLRVSDRLGNQSPDDSLGNSTKTRQ